MERKIVIVAPTYNEEENIASFLQSLPQNVKIVIADSHSQDKTASVVKSFKSKNIYYLDVERRGLGLGLIKGLDYAVDKLKAEILVTMEADLSCDPRQLPAFLQKLTTADLVLGSRYAAGGAVKNWSWWRRFLSRGANFALMLLAGTIQIHEFTNLYRVFTKEVWVATRKKLKNNFDWLLVPAFVFETMSTNFKITEQPIIYVDRFGGRSKMNTVGYTKSLLVYAVKKRIQKSASFFKFLVVGGLGFVINTVVLIFGVSFGMTPANAGILGAELAIISNFFWNNLWTFSQRRFSSWKVIPAKFIQFNVLSFGSALIQYVSLRIGEFIFGLEKYKSPILDWPLVRLASWYMLFYVVGVGLGLIWNYFMYSRVIWKKK